MTFSLRYLRVFAKDRLFLLLFVLTSLTLLAAILLRQPTIERSPIPFELVVLFFSVNMLFAFFTLRREPLLAYMFLTASTLMNGTLLFYYRYLVAVQKG